MSGRAGEELGRGWSHQAPQEDINRRAIVPPSLNELVY